MKTAVIILVALIGTLLLSCDPVTYGTIYIANHSTDSLKYHYTGTYPPLDSFLTILPSETKGIYTYEIRENPKQFYCCPCVFDSLILMTNDSIQIKKETKYTIYWEIDKSQLKMWNDHKIDCYFSVTQSDIE